MIRFYFKIENLSKCEADINLTEEVFIEGIMHDISLAC